jgi:hypothetical protein
MPKELVTAEEVLQAIMQRITTGVYEPGDVALRQAIGARDWIEPKYRQ